MTAAVFVTITCHYCRRQRAPLDIIPLPGGIKMCLGCYHQHREACNVLSGKPPTECSECHTAFDDIPRDAGGNVRLVVHYEGGLYKCMCLPCSDVYIPKRRDLYGPTEYGWKKKLV